MADPTHCDNSWGSLGHGGHRGRGAARPSGAHLEGAGVPPSSSHRGALVRVYRAQDAVPGPPLPLCCFPAGRMPATDPTPEELEGPPAVATGHAPCLTYDDFVDWA